ncbi:MAG: hypothetical protein U1F83_00430 [Verrucomicrobiota bacterium]
MKTYILRRTPTVQRQSRHAPPATAGAVLGHPFAPAPRGPALLIGLGVHTRSIAVSLAPRRCQSNFAAG